MKRAVYIVAVVLLSGLAAFGAAELTLALGLGSEAATLAGLAAFFGNFFMIFIVRKSYLARTARAFLTSTSCGNGLAVCG